MKKNQIHILYGIYHSLICVMIIYLITFTVFRPFSFQPQISNFDYLFGGITFLFMSAGIFLKSKYGKSYGLFGAVISIFFIATVFYYNLSIVFFEIHFFIPILLLAVLSYSCYLTYRAKAFKH